MEKSASVVFLRFYAFLRPQIFPMLLGSAPPPVSGYGFSTKESCCMGVIALNNQPDSDGKNAHAVAAEGGQQGFIHRMTGDQSGAEKV